jgi:hypothetical protein
VVGAQQLEEEAKMMNACAPSLMGSFQLPRSFSWPLLLSPFKYEALKRALLASRPAALVDEAHFTLARIMRAQYTDEGDPADKAANWLGTA